MKKIGIYVGLFLSLSVGICYADVLFSEDVKHTVKGMKVYKTELKKMAHETRLEKLHDVLCVAKIDVKDQ